MKVSNLGYPRIGAKREWKKALESFWDGKLDAPGLEKRMKEIRLDHLQTQRLKGVDLIPVNDFTCYDHMLDMATMFGWVPKRFNHQGGPVPLQDYFAMARGKQDAVACEMTKWFNTNYHYIVPEYEEEMEFSLLENRPLKAFREAKEELGIDGKPVIIGPYTFLKLSKGYSSGQFENLLNRLIPLYIQMLGELAEAGCSWVQMDEPVFVADLSKEDMKLAKEIYNQFKRAVPEIHLIIQTYFDSVEHYEDLISFPAAGIGLDFVHGKTGNLDSIRKYGFPADKCLGIGCIDGRNIWRNHLQETIRFIQELDDFISPREWFLQPSCSLLHVPVRKDQETDLDSVLYRSLSFADEKLEELHLLKQALSHGSESISEQLNAAAEALDDLSTHEMRHRPSVRKHLKHLREEEFNRKSPFQIRQQIQREYLQLPLLPTTTIGSFPQTPEVRKARRKWRIKEWTQEQYDEFMQTEIQKWMQIQEEIGLDVLVHGEFERNDMVEFFGERLGGFAFTKHGWVQSYGSRCVKPPIIYGDIEFRSPMTVKESKFAQSCTEKPVKGMLTGPVTILHWSFVRNDLSKKEVAAQIALALRQEVQSLEANGIRIIQVDEPALREGLPLKKKNWNHYLEWAVRSFRLATSAVDDRTQIHTHMCYSQFDDIMESIQQLDADVISIEASRSHGELIQTLRNHSYKKGIGLGVYDIHSPRIPSADEIKTQIEHALLVCDRQLFWVNPDCGLKTRKQEEVIHSLTHMVTAAKLVRSEIARNV
ncbi:5-methyltetrahydropteroyltriglutamate--homocysteine S-methyltransferase [Paenactinomyces guangxiensis]|uniref:5-methyltetrahydropteroyltriglutamate--homocysteine methyltransferase n=1 Tax=Paenactinomyces guangxiensis TaxID=1490290 RepID=A0A7W1WQH0_9BACL|nr:5-methyltetrahydropteroyltriglutamate--homocysteine S-methyltransferase [Paenactinomyces guangxiensis]MBA4494185.1 5-methyltetrahydropteroyltriglutamate--homocysteine S-methyltransferase [Paenactinomyces guangxiensis]MBH8590681.1 5-methyltetrahydropteroyltriglutamate--homocysteine S-methyltransferase [Paenactinomyces guangxiensis]